MLKWIRSTGLSAGYGLMGMENWGLEPRIEGCEWTRPKRKSVGRRGWLLAGWLADGYWAAETDMSQEKSGSGGWILDA